MLFCIIKIVCDFTKNNKDFYFFINGESIKCNDSLQFKNDKIAFKLPNFKKNDKWYDTFQDWYL